MESKVLGNLLLITINFWTVWYILEMGNLLLCKTTVDQKNPSTDLDWRNQWQQILAESLLFASSLLDCCSAKLCQNYEWGKQETKTSSFRVNTLFLNQNMYSFLQQTRGSPPTWLLLMYICKYVYIWFFVTYFLSGWIHISWIFFKCLLKSFASNTDLKTNHYFSNNIEVNNVSWKKICEEKGKLLNPIPTRQVTCDNA